MKKAQYALTLAFILFIFSPAYAQWIDEGKEEWARLNFPKAWTSYLYRNKADRSILRLNFYRDTVSVEEMRTAFEQHKDTYFKTSPYTGYDSIDTYYGKLLVLRSPLKDVPMKDIWMKQRKSKYAKDITGDFIFLQEPQFYMGYIVSPNPILETRHEGRLLAEEAETDGRADFFCFMQRSSNTIDGTWKSYLKDGAKLLGTLIGMDSNFTIDNEELSFSVLLYEKPKGETGTDGIYGLELLSPKDPDGLIQGAFNEMQWFVRKLPYGTYRPLYTTDFRIMTGRYYRVTVNRCGCLVEDYMDINNRKAGQQ